MVRVDWHRLTKRTALMSFAIGLVLAVLLGGAALLDVRFLAVWQRELSDMLFIERDIDPRVVIVGVDETSLKELGRWPWPRNRHAELISALTSAGASAVGMDVAFSEAADSADDAALSAAIARNGHVALATAGDLPTRQSTRGYLTVRSLELPTPALSGYELGHVHVIPDSDGVVRTMPLLVKDGERVLPTLSLVTLTLAEPAVVVPEPRDTSTVELGDRSVPVELGSRLRINFAGPRGTFPTYSFVDVIKGRVDPDAFKGKIVLVGITAKALGDTYMTPGSGGHPTPGVEIHANALDTVLQERFIAPEPSSTSALIAVVLCIVLSLVYSRMRPSRSAIVMVVLLIASVLVSLLRFEMGTMANIVYPPLAIAGSYVGVLAYRVGFESREKRRVQALFGKYVKPEVVEELLASAAEDTVDLSGIEQPVSVLFADIRGFTTISESLEPPEVVAMLNYYLQYMTEVIFHTDGTLDKYIGDCVMAFWNAPQPQPDHALRAVKSALEMQTLLAKALSEASDMDIPEAHFGIGINTGLAVVGNVGSSLRVDYTIIGDAVNLSSRLCGVAEAGHIIISAGTYEEVKEHVIATELAPVKVKGKAEPVQIYDVLGLKE